MIPERKTVAIVGGGLAGLSLATELAEAGFSVKIYEAAPYLGGRASSHVDPSTGDAVPIGPHVFVESYVNFRKFLRKTGCEENISWERRRFIEVVHEGRHHTLKFISRIPAANTLHWLFSFPFISLRDKLSNARFFWKVGTTGFTSIERLDDLSAHDFLVSCGVSDRSIDLFWEFISLSLLNIPLRECSAAEFTLLVKRWSRLKHGKFGFPKTGLSDLYINGATQHLRKNDAEIFLNHRVEEILISGGRIIGLQISEHGHQSRVTADYYVLTLNPIQLRELLGTTFIFDNPYFASLKEFVPVPYISVNLWFRTKLTRKQFWAMLGSGAGHVPGYLNTDFYDLSNIYKNREGGSYIASNIINSAAYEHLDDSEIVARTIRELRETFPHLESSRLDPTHHKVNRTPYVVYAPLPGSRSWKRGPETPFENLYLAGDWTVREGPQCMEVAVFSAYRTAEEILKKEGMCVTIADRNLLV